MTAWKLTPRQRARVKKSTAAYRKRYAALSQRATIAQISEFDAQLVPVCYGSGVCWIFPSGSGGQGKNYGRMRFNGVMVQSHRFAMAAHLNIPLWNLEGYDVAHAPIETCLGGRCCDPSHLEPKPENPNRSFDRIRDGISGHRKPRPELIKLLYPVGLPANGRLFDGPWDSNASPQLLRLLEMGLHDELLKAQETAFGPLREIGTTAA